jgi:hypothetical protein
MTTPRGHDYHFTWDALCRLFQDFDPAGGYKQLTRTEDPSRTSTLVLPPRCAKDSPRPSLSSRSVSPAGSTAAWDSTNLIEGLTSQVAKFTPQRASPEPVNESETVTFRV